MAKELKLAIAGVGNCASALIQGLSYYKKVDNNHELVPGLMHNVLGGYRIADVKPVAAFDVDLRKVGKDLSEAIFALPNCTKVFCKDVPRLGVKVEKGPVLDGVAKHMEDFPDDKSFRVSGDKPVDVAKVLRETGAEVLVNYMPVGSEDAAKYYAKAAIDAGCAFVNCMPVFISSTKEWADRFEKAGLPCVGDDIKSQVGATITHRVLAKLFSDRGVKVDRTYQLNTGGNSVTGDQELLLEVNGKIKKTRIGDFIDKFIDAHGTRRADGKDVVNVTGTGQEIKCFTINNEYGIQLSDVQGLIRHKVESQLYEISTEEGNTITITPDHNVFVLSGSGELEAVPVRELKPGETYIASPRALLTESPELKKINILPSIKDTFSHTLENGYLRIRGSPNINIPADFPVTDELLQLAGLWLADGNYDRASDSANIELACGHEPECMDILETFLGNFNIGYDIAANRVKVRVHSKTLGRIFRSALGLSGNAYTKRAPQWMFSLSARQIALVLRGYVSGDGCVTGKQVRWTSASKELVEDMRDLFMLTGIHSTMFSEKTGGKSSYHTEKEKHWHGIISSKEDIEMFKERAGFIQDYKNTALEEACNKLTKGMTHRIPRIGLVKKWGIRSTSLHKTKTLRAYTTLSRLSHVKDAKERERLRQICSGGTRFLKIKSVRKVERGGYVYDISTKPFERFICSNLLVHNTDFLNMLERARLKSKKISKTQAVQANFPAPLHPDNIHIGPSDYVPWQKDNKICFIRLEGRKFGDVPLDLELRLSVEDSPNSAGVAIDAIRCAKLALDRGTKGQLLSISSYCMKSPPQQFPDNIARTMVDEFIKGERER